MGIVYEVTAVTGKYTDRDGKEKSRYQRIGVVMETRNGLMLKLESMPIVEGGWSGFAYLNEPKERESTGGGHGGSRGGAPQRQRPAPATNHQNRGGVDGFDESFDDDIPFISDRGSW